MNLFFVFIFSLLLGCASESRVKIYKIDYQRQMLIRDLKEKDTLTYEQADGFLCMSQKDVERFADQLVTKEAFSKEKIETGFHP